MVVLMAAAGFDRVLGDTDPRVAGRVLLAASVCTVIVVLVLIEGWLLSAFFTPSVRVMPAIVRGGLLVLVPCILLGQRFMFDSRGARSLLAGAVLLLAFADLTKYFADVSYTDLRFTERTRYHEVMDWRITYPLSSDIQRRLLSVWTVPNRDSGFASNVYGNMPVPSEFWPANRYMSHRYLVAGDASLGAIIEEALNGTPLEFYCRHEARRLAGATGSGAAAAADGSPLPRALWLADAPHVVAGARGGPPAPAEGCEDAHRRFTAVWREWSYNTFEFDVDVPENGFVLVRQLADPRWQVTVDGTGVEAVQANVAALAVPVAAGRHRLRMDYQPLARRLYWPAGILLEATWVGALIAAVQARRT
jgi:hypothetical protein